MVGAGWKCVDYLSSCATSEVNLGEKSVYEPDVTFVFCMSVELFGEAGATEKQQLGVRRKGKGLIRYRFLKLPQDR